MNQIMKIKGRLGNILFQLAYAYTHNINLFKFNSITDRLYYDSYNLLPHLQIVTKQHFQGIYIQDITKPAEVSNKELIDGYFESEDYFNKESIQPLIQPYQSEVINAVGITIRLGDFKNSIYNVPPLEWYESIYNTYFKGYKAIISSDEEITLNIPNAVYSFNSPEENLIQIAKCKHHIGSNSTFSWWASYINETKDSINFFPEYKYNDKTIYETNYLPKRWYRL